MKHLFDVGNVAEIRARVARLGPTSERQWGSMDAAQTMAHCASQLDLPSGVRRPARAFIGRIMGWAIKRMSFRDDSPMPRNAPTIPELVVTDPRDFASEQRRLLAAIDHFVSGGPRACTDHPHPFFGRLTPEEWAIHEYKHLDHHLRQFGG